MKILSLNVNNFLRIEALEITPRGNTVKITGKNDQGKSSTLKAIDAALTGGKGAEEPIHGDATKAEIELKLGSGETINYIVKRTYVRRDDKPVLATLTVTTPDGAKYGKPQETLDKILGAVSLDPVKFLEMKPDQQAKAVRAFVPDYDFVAAEKEIKANFDKRTDVNREVARLKAELDGLGDARDVAEPIDVSQLLQAIEDAGKAERAKMEAEQHVKDAEFKIEAYGRNKDAIQRKIDGLKAQLADAEKEMAENDRFIDSGRVMLEEVAAKVSQMRPIPDVSEIRTKIDEAQSFNEQQAEARMHNSRIERLKAALEVQEKEAAALTKAITDGREAGDKAMANAKLPVEGLSFTEDTVLLNGYPFSQASFSKRLMTAVAIAAAHAPELRLVRIEDGDKLDDDSQEALAKFADEHDLQVWMETVQHGEPVGFVIEDGKLKGYAE